MTINFDYLRELLKYTGITLISGAALILCWQLYIWFTDGKWIVVPLCTVTQYFTGSRSLSCPLNQPLALYMLVAGSILLIWGWFSGKADSN